MCSSLKPYFHPEYLVLSEDSPHPCPSADLYLNPETAPPPPHSLALAVMVIGLMSILGKGKAVCTAEEC